MSRKYAASTCLLALPPNGAAANLPPRGPAPNKTCRHFPASEVQAISLVPRIVGLLLAGAALPVHAQEVPLPAAEETVDFAADQLTYDPDTEIVRASGNVVVVRGDYRLTAQEVAYDRNTGIVTAQGDVRIIDPAGNEVFAGEVELSDELRDGAIDNFLLVLEDGGRLAAASGQREAGVSRLDRAVYSPCDVIGADGCPKQPLWQIKAVEVTHDPEAERIRYRDARLEILGVPILYLPGLSHADSPGARASGILMPDFRIDNDTGVSASLPYYWALAPNRDLTVRPTLYTEVAPSLGAEYRQLTAAGPFRVGGIVTYAGEERLIPGTAGSIVSEDQLRGYLFGNGQFQHSEHWQTTFGMRVTTDDTFLRRYELSRDTTLRNFAQVERHGAQSFLSVEGWAFQGLGFDDDQGLIPIALPVARYTYIPEERIAGGRLTLDAKSALVTRTDGMDNFRLSAGGEWKRSLFTPLGQRITGRALVRADGYRTEDADLAVLPTYAGENSWEGRIIPAAAIDAEWPLAGPAFGGIQRITPRLQLSASPRDLNGGIPNEDSRSVDLETTNLFDISRFPGRDRWEGGARITYGAAYRLTRPRWLVESEIGQSYSFEDSPDILPDGVGIAENFSDFVGRNTVRIGRRFDLVHRFRLDKDSFKVRRNEVDVSIGGYRDYLTLGYLKLDRDIGIEDLADREEVRGGGRLQLTRYWSVFGSVIIDLTDQSEDPISLSDGFEPIRHRIGLNYEDDCFEFGVTWRRDYIETIDLDRGNTFSFNVSLKNLGR